MQIEIFVSRDGILKTRAVNARVDGRGSIVTTRVNGKQEWKNQQRYGATGKR
jgi:hypothetical protein